MTNLSRRSAVAACAAATLAPRALRAQNLPTIHVGYQPYQYSAQVLYAQEIGAFTRAGIKADLQQVALGAALAAAVASGAEDVGLATVSTLAVAHSKGIPFVIIAPAAEYHASAKPVGELMVGNQTSIHSAKDMNGKVVGTPGLATMGEYGVRAWVDANGGDSTTLKFQEMPFGQMPAAFASGRIDAAELGEPFLSEAKKYARVLATNMQSSMGSNFLVTAWFATAPWAQAHSDLVGRFATAMREAAAWAAKNPTQCIQILARTFNQDPATISADTLARFGQSMTPADLAPAIEVTARYAKFPPFPPEELMYVTR